ncbi:MAG: DUF1553 domain-containing protein, partial [Candidatus Hydrogenedentes bacterium]|nr:DUF1553 domain-containing protein [Candidatus Hydrogenedentota bacterium]
WFARNAVNRVWAWLFGRGIVNPPDDMGPECPPTRPELLEYLAHELVRSDFDMRHIYRLILNSSTYQQSSIPHGDIEVAEAHFACYPIRRLDAEVLVDAVGGLLAAPVEYSSAIPEPYTYIPATERSIALADGSISSPVLEMFGRPARDTGFFSERNNDPTEEQRRYLLNSSEIQRRIERGPRLRRVLEANKGNPENAVRDIYIAVLSRPPTAEELAVVGRYAQSGGVTRKQTADDLVWALINTKEFLYRH